MSANILIIDPEFSTRNSLCQQLIQRGCIASEASGLNDFLQCFDTETRFDVALVALSDLKEEALLLIKNIKSNWPETEVIILTGRGDLALSIQAMKLGAFDDITVPIDVEALLSKIQAAIEKKNGCAG